MDWKYTSISNWSAGEIEYNDDDAVVQDTTKHKKYNFDPISRILRN